MPKCPIETIAKDYAALEAAQRNQPSARAIDEIDDRLEFLRVAASMVRATSGAGCMFQIAVASEAIKELEATESGHEDHALLARRINRLLYSVACSLATWAPVAGSPAAGLDSARLLMPVNGNPDLLVPPMTSLAALAPPRRPRKSKKKADPVAPKEAPRVRLVPAGVGATDPVRLGSRS